MAADADLVALLRSISNGQTEVALQMLAARPELATARLPRDDEQFLDACRLQVYAGDTALHVAAAAYDIDAVDALIKNGAALDARNRRSAQPLHAATMGGPGGDRWDPQRQSAMIRRLIEAGAEVDAVASGGVTPLHRAVRNRCSAAVQTLLEAGADPRRRNDSGSSAMDLTKWTTGRPGSGTDAAKAEQQAIVALLEDPSRSR